MIDYAIMFYGPRDKASVFDGRGGRAYPGEPERFLRRVTQSPPEGCVFWPYSKDRLGYGRINMGGRQKPAHRAAWEVYHGKVMPPEMDACHNPTICNNRACMNPLHIRPDTRRANMSDTILAGTRLRGASSPKAKLSESQARLILADARPYTRIAEDYGVSYDTVRSIKAGRRWSHLGTPAPSGAIL